MESNAKWVVNNLETGDYYANGELHLALNGTECAGHCFYSDVITTGFQPGPFSLRFAVVDTEGYDGGLLTKDRLLFGDSEVFAQSSYIPGVPPVSVGAYADPYDGSFRFGVMLKKPAVNCTLKLLWWAEKPVSPELIRLAEAGREEAPAVKVVINNVEPVENEPEAEPFFICNAPRKLHPGESCEFRCVLPKGAEAVEWSVSSEDGGTITPEGVYTAPAYQGIYQILARIPEQNRETSLYIMVN